MKKVMRRYNSPEIIELCQVTAGVLCSSGSSFENFTTGGTIDSFDDQGL